MLALDHEILDRELQAAYKILDTFTVVVPRFAFRTLCANKCSRVLQKGRTKVHEALQHDRAQISLIQKRSKYSQQIETMQKAINQAGDLEVRALAMSGARISQRT